MNDDVNTVDDRDKSAKNELDREWEHRHEVSDDFKKICLILFMLVLYALTVILL